MIRFFLTFTSIGLIVVTLFFSVNYVLFQQFLTVFPKIHNQATCLERERLVSDLQNNSFPNYDVSYTTNFSSLPITFLHSGCLSEREELLFLNTILNFFEFSPLKKNFEEITKYSLIDKIFIVISPDERLIAGTNTHIGSLGLITFNPFHTSFLENSGLLTTLVNELLEVGRPDDVRLTYQFQIVTAASHISLNNIFFKPFFISFSPENKTEFSDQMIYNLSAICSSFESSLNSISSYYMQNNYYEQFDTISSISSYNKMIYELNNHLSLFWLDQCFVFISDENGGFPRLEMI